MRKRWRMARRKPHESGALKQVVAADAVGASLVRQDAGRNAPRVSDSAAQLNSVLSVSRKWTSIFLRIPVSV